MSQSVITTAFEQLKAQQAANGGILQLDEFVFANVPDLNIHDPINRAESWPAASDIVYRQAVTKTGMVNNNAVVYSVVLGADVGDFDFNWIGLINKKSNAVCMIVHAPLQKKIKTASGQQGNVLTRSFMMEYDGAAQQTQIITPADTWQIDFTARLNGMDERIRLENIDLWGSAVFFGESFRVTPEGDKYAVKSGTGYVAGLRAELFTDQVLSVPAMGGKVWVDVCWKGTLSGAWSTSVRLTVADALADYHDGDEQHYVFAVAQINADGSVVDLRNTGNEGINHQLDGINHQLDNKQPLSDTLTALARLAGSKDKVSYFPSDSEAALTALTKVGRDLIGKEAIADVLSYLGLGAGAPAIGIPFFWPSAVMPNIVMPEWSGMVFLKWNGAEFSAATYPKLALVIPGLKLSDARGTFPRIADDARGIDPGRELLSEQGDAIRNITGFFRAVDDNSSDVTTGAFYVAGNAGTGSGGSSVEKKIGFDASLVVPTADENRPRNIAFNFLVRAK